MFDDDKFNTQQWKCLIIVLGDILPCYEIYLV